MCDPEVVSENMAHLGECRCTATTMTEEALGPIRCMLELGHPGRHFAHEGDRAGDVSWTGIRP